MSRFIWKLNRLWPLEAKELPRQLQISEYSLAVINRCMGQKAVFDDETRILMSAFVSSPMDIPDQAKWLPMLIDDVPVLIDHYTAQICLHGVLITKWEPEGVDVTAFPGIVMHLCENGTDDFKPLPQEKVTELALRQHILSQDAFREIKLIISNEANYESKQVIR